ncbi:HAMP domain-containing sensor histidine kinase [Paenibacillus sp. JCM 10914]|uniref:sensor histidine kinase n=1 Tax=Paenibacillus sp. JCM 10914 TaxID=1236974 RepID=UPI0003CC86CD|nr:HAMP domain-containing sensor histidine kinase [Paenibacillus sp. JCM 10914]GAE07753.1 membrane-associated sensory histidine kinase with HAMP domain [Paenibacillus sp. JCM 10914]
MKFNPLISLSPTSKRSLRTQLLARSLLVLAILLILIGAFQYVLMKNALFRNQAETLQLQLRSMPRELWAPEHARRGDPPSMVGVMPPAGNSKEGLNGPGERPVFFLPNMSLATIDANGEFVDLAVENNTAAPQLSADAYTKIMEQLKLRQPGNYEVVDNRNGTEQLIVFRPSGSPDNPTGLLQLGVNTESLHAVLSRQLLIFAALALLAMAGGIALYLPLLRQTLNPLNRMVETVKKIDAGNLGNRFPSVQGQLEIDRLSVSFNGMLERLEDAFEAEREAKEQMRRFIADASHELRTPLTSIHGFLEVLQRGAASHPEQLQSALFSMHGESTRMKKLVEDLLLLAKLDRKPELQLEVIRLDLLLSEMEPHLRMLAQDRDVTFHAMQIQCLCDPDKIKQVIYNLFHNAVQHTNGTTGYVTVALHTNQHGQWAVLSVEDNGSGISEAHLPHLFERFYRVDESRGRQQGGSGLGLAIAQSILSAHGGNISVVSKLQEGTVFHAEWPVGIIS